MVVGIKTLFLKKCDMGKVTKTDLLPLGEREEKRLFQIKAGVCIQV